MSQISCSLKTQQGNHTLYPQGVRINQFSSGNLARIAKPNKKACVQPRLKSNKRNRSLLRKMKEVFSRKKTLVRVTKNSALTPFWVRSRQAPHQVSNFNHTWAYSQTLIWLWNLHMASGLLIPEEIWNTRHLVTWCSLPPVSVSWWTLIIERKSSLTFIRRMLCRWRFILTETSWRLVAWQVKN